MIYPFRFNIGDHVTNTNKSDAYHGVTGKVKALELSAERTTAVVQPDNTEKPPFRVHESWLRCTG